MSENHDPHNGPVRDAINDGVAKVYAGWPATRAKMLKEGATSFDIAHAQGEALRNVYRDAGVK